MLSSRTLRRFGKQLQFFPQKSLSYDGATAAAYVAYAWSEQAFIYPITPATPMGEAVSNWSGQGRKNLFGTKVDVTQMQSEGGAAGAVHGVVDVGCLASTFTSSQGLLLMIPNMYIIAGALNPCVFHVAARSVTKHALCIFGDHTDVMATRQTGWALLSGHNVQQSQDMALISHVATLKSSVPFMNFFDGFRTSHEINTLDLIPYDAMEQLVPHKELAEFRRMGLNPNRPHSRQAGQFSDSFFQNSEAANKFYDRVPDVVEETMKDVAVVTGRKYSIFEYVGHPEADYVVVSMGSSCSTIESILEHQQNRLKAHGVEGKIGMVKVHLYRPWDAKRFLAALPKTAKRIAVLDRTKEQTALGEPLFLDVAATLQGAGMTTKVIGGRYGLGSKEFTPAMAKAVFENLMTPRNPIESFTVGIEDDVTFKSIKVGPETDVTPSGTRQCLFWGMGSDGTVSANKNAIKLIGDNTKLKVQAYFAYDSKKAGGCTISHLRFGPSKIDAPYQIVTADYIAVSQTTWPDKFPQVLLESLKEKGTAVFNTSATTVEEFEDRMPLAILNDIGKRRAQVYAIDANAVAKACGLGRHTNNVLTAVFFKLSGVLPYEEAETLLKSSLKKAYGSKGDDLVKRNLNGVDQAIAALVKLNPPYEKWASMKEANAEKRMAEQYESLSAFGDVSKPDFVKKLVDPLGALEGNRLPVSYFDPRGHQPNALTKYEKRGIALTVPIVDMDKCTQCNKCSMICPHAAIRPFLLTQLESDKAPKQFDARPAKGGNDLAGHMYRIQVAPEDCTGCEACSFACPDDALTMTPLPDVIDKERENWTYAANLPNRGSLVDRTTAKGSQFQQPMLEFSGACEGCGETPYAKLCTQLFGERMIIANASGCSTVWAGTSAGSPLAVNKDGQGPAWGRSLFEDAAEYGLGMARAVQGRRGLLKTKVEEILADDEAKQVLPPLLLESLEEWISKYEDPNITQELSKRIPALVTDLETGFAGGAAALHERVPQLKDLMDMKDHLPKLSVWVWGGDGWAYDIGFGGLDHVLSSKTKINVLVMDTEGYSNTGGQISKATNLGAVQKFAPTGYKRAKKDLGAMAMAYEDIYVASISIGANYAQAVKALTEAEAYPGPSLILCYSPCIEHKILFPRGLSRLAEEMSKAVESGYWQLYRYNPELRALGQNPFSLDSKRISMNMKDFTKLENRFATLERSNPALANTLSDQLQSWAKERNERFKWMEAHFVPRLDAEAKARTAAAATAGANAAPSAGPLWILYGSDTGTTAELARRFSDESKARGFDVKVLELDEVVPEALQSMSNVVVMCSTAGEGDFPANAHAFWESLSDKSLSPELLKSTKFSVFGLGDTGYKHFNAAAKKIEQRLKELGATPTQATGLGNDRDEDKWETQWGQWLPEFWKVQQAPPSPSENEVPLPVFELEECKGQSYSYMQVHPPKTRMVPVSSNKRITPSDYDRIIRHIVFDIKGTDFSYLLGDALTIYPSNDPDGVSSFLSAYGQDPARVVKVKSLKALDARREASYRHPMSLQQIFCEVIDILGRPSKTFYNQLRKFATDPKQKAELELICGESKEGSTLYQKLSAETLTYADVLLRYPSAKPTVEQLMTIIPCIKPRLYSIASSQRLVNDQVEIAVVILDWKTPSGKARRGLGTTFLQYISGEGKGQAKNLSLGSLAKNPLVPCSVTAGTFNFPKSLMQPYVMTGLGTGLAPFRAFVQERAYWKRKGVATGPMWLFYGCRHKAKDYIFGDELESYFKEGVLTELRPAFSRDQKEKIYVQHRMLEAKDRLYDDLVNKNGYFYMCGQAGQLERDVRNAVITSFEQGGHMSRADAEKLFEKLEEEGRYCRELY